MTHVQDPASRPLLDTRSQYLSRESSYLLSVHFIVVEFEFEQRLLMMSKHQSVSDPAVRSLNLTANGGDLERPKLEKRLLLKVDLRLCTIAGLLCSLNLLDSGIISSASVTSMLTDLGLAEGNRYSVAILIFTVAALCFQLPATIAVRRIGPRIFFALITVSFGVLTVVRVRPSVKSDNMWLKSGTVYSIHTHVEANDLDACFARNSHGILAASKHIRELC